jgi:serine protease AprX
MKKLLLLTFTAALALSATAQTKKFWIRFSDKNSSPYSVGNPSAFLSQKAIDRRNRQSIPVVTGDLPVNPSYISSVVQQGAKILSRSRWLNGVAVEADDATIAKINALPFVLGSRRLARKGSGEKSKNYFEAEEYKPFERSALARVSSSTPYNYGFSFNQINMLKGDLLHAQGFDGRDMTIAVLDAGFYSVDTLPAFDSLWANNQILGTWDFVNNEASVFEDNSHGMAVLSTIGGNIPGQLVGTAPKAKFWLLRSEDVFSEYEIEECFWAAAAEFADSVGADIVTTSLGYTTFDDIDFTPNPASHTYSQMDGNTALATRAADIAASKGMLVVASAGNEGGSPWYYIGAPADGDSVLAIGAVRPTRNLAGFSSRGPSADGRVKPNVMAQGSDCIIQDDNGSVGLASGTSFACPILAGMAACLWQAHPNLSSMQIFDAIQRSAHRYTTPTDSLGYGIPDFMSANGILTSVNNPNLSRSFYVYPNPSGALGFTLLLHSDTSESITLEIFDMAGRKILSENRSLYTGINALSVESPEEKGLFILRVTTGKEIRTTKLIRQ